MEPVNFLQSTTLNINQEYVNIHEPHDLEPHEVAASAMEVDGIDASPSAPAEEVHETHDDVSEEVLYNEGEGIGDDEVIDSMEVDLYFSTSNSPSELYSEERRTGHEGLVDLTEEMLQIEVEDESTAIDPLALTQSEEDDTLNADVSEEARPVEVIEQVDTIETIDGEEEQSEEEQSEAIEMDEMPKLIPIQSKRIDASVRSPAEMPPLIPITKHNNRLHMAQLIERKLQSEIEDYEYECDNDDQPSIAQLANGHSDQEEEEKEQIDVAEEVLEEEEQVPAEAERECEQVQLEPEKEDDDEVEQKKPLIGSIHKSIRKAARLTKPPWLSADEEEEEEEEEGSRDEADKIEEIEEDPTCTSENEMRAKLFSQLQMLKVKRKAEPLFRSKMLSNVHYEKRISKILPEPAESHSSLGIKIVAVAGGVDLGNETCEELIPAAEHLPQKDTEHEMAQSNKEKINLNQVIINEHLDLPTIKLTKTKDYTKIKGWNRKRLLTLNETETTSVTHHEEEQTTPGCSYYVDKSTEIGIAVTRSNEKETPQVEESTNIFASNILDGFLQEKDLNISYNVPNLKSTNHNINLLDDCVLIDVELERKAEQQRKSLGPENDDSNSSSSSKEHVATAKVDYKPRTLAEKRKMLSDEKDTVKVEPKKFKSANATSVLKKEAESTKIIPKNESIKTYHRGIPNFTSRSVTTAIKNENAEVIDDDDDDDDNLLVPITDASRNNLSDEAYSHVVFLTEEESKPKKCFKSKIRSFNKYSNAYQVITRNPIDNRKFYRRVGDIRRKCRIDYVPKDSFLTRKRKPSILTSPPPSVDYKPGPMCKKHELQVNGTRNWRTVVLELPKVNVLVKPDVGKKMHPRVRPFIKFDTFHISQDRAEFALSALVTSDSNTTEKKSINTTEKKSINTTEKKSISFPAYYAHRQEKFVVRKRYEPKKEEVLVRNIKKIEETEQDVAKTIKDVMGLMLDYVETKDVGSTILPYDDERDAVNETPTDSPTKDEKQKVDSKRKKLPGFDGVKRELRQLNVLIVDLPKEECDENDGNCKNASCRLGCICQSISTKYPASTHCGEAICVFACVCGFERRCTMNAQYNGLNERTISRLNKEAKRNITAREERDFTQTAIRSSNNTIIIGKNRESKRTPKYNFKRYEDFHFGFTADQSRMLQYVNKKIIQCDKKLKHCSVDLVKCDFRDFIPFCLVHNLYDCHCGGTAEYDREEQEIIAQIQSRKDGVDSSQAPQDDKSDINDAEPPKKVQNVAVPTSTTNLISGGSPSSVRTTERNSNNSWGLSARLRGTGEFYQARNKSNKFKITMARKLKYDKTVDQDIVNKWFILPSDLRALNTSTNRRKQDLKSINQSSADCDKPVFTDADRLKSELASKQQPEQEVQPSSDKQPSNKQPPPILVEPKTVRHCLKYIGTTLTISGALYSPTPAISKKFSQMIGSKTTPPTEFRLLLWPSLMELYISADIQIWYSNANNKLRFVITDSLTNPKEGFRNIRTFEGSSSKKGEIKVDFIKWIVTRSLPEAKKGENILVILKINEFYWEICGICAKHQNNGCDKVKQKSVLIDKYQKSKKTSDSLAPPDIGKENTASVNEEVHTVTEKYYKTVQQVVFANGTFAQKDLVLADHTDVSKGELRIAASLPNIGQQGRWRVLKVNSNFAILSFTKNEFSIKCSDILTVMKVAMKYNKTIIINTAEVSANYKHKSFGIYIPPTYQDRIFIGPYLVNEEHGLETLRFVNNQLINTEVFNAMRGITGIACNGLWYQQLAPSVKINIPGLNSVIDLTGLDEVRTLMQSTDLTILPAPTTDPSSVSQNIKPPRKTKPTKRVLETNTEIIPIGQSRSASTNSYKINDGIIQVPSSTKILQVPGRSQGERESLLIPTLRPENMVRHDPLKYTPTAGGNKCKMPELIKIPLLPNKNNKNITNVNVTTDSKQMSLVESIIQQAQTAPPRNLEILFQMRLRIIMERSHMKMPPGGKPLCFRLNFGNGVILGFMHRQRVSIYWPGDHVPKIDFLNINDAIEWLQSELHAVFICIPTTFKIQVTLVGPSHYLDYINRSVISQKYFKEICVIGDFGIMRLSEAEQYLLCSDRNAAKMKLASAETKKSDKFKRAILSILDSNDMTTMQFLAKVNDLIAKAKAAADIIPNSASPISCKWESIIKTSQMKKANNEVIALDSETDEISDAQTMESSEAESEISTKCNNSTFIELSSVRKIVPTVIKSVNKQKLKSPTKRPNIMRIDLRHMTTAKAKEMLKCFVSGRKTLTEQEFQGLQVYSEIVKKNGVHDSTTDRDN